MIFQEDFQPVINHHGFFHKIQWFPSCFSSNSDHQPNQLNWYNIYIYIIYIYVYWSFTPISISCILYRYIPFLMGKNSWDNFLCILSWTVGCIVYIYTIIYIYNTTYSPRFSGTTAPFVPSTPIFKAGTHTIRGGSLMILTRKWLVGRFHPFHPTMWGPRSIAKLVYNSNNYGLWYL